MIEQRICGTVYGVILNDRGSLERLGAALSEAPYKATPKAPVMYIKPANTLVESGTAVALPQGAASVEVGATIGVVFGREASRVEPGHAADVIEGYAVVADLSLPHESYYRPAVREKCFDGACPVGARIVPANEVAALDGVTLRTFVDGKLAQSRSLKALVRDVPALIAEISAFMTLRRGDMLLVGVVYQAAQACIGAQVRVEADQIGSVEFSIAVPWEGVQ